MTLIRSSLLNGIAVSVKLLTALVLNKVLAVMIGPAGYAVVGQFNSVVGIVMSVATGGLTNGVVKYTAERHDAPRERARLWATAARIVLGASLAAGLAVAALSPWLAERVLANASLTPAFYWLAASLFLFAANSLLLAMLNGLKELRRYVAANILGSLVGLACTLVLAVNYGLLGALISASVSQSIALFCTLAVCRKAAWFKRDPLSAGFHRQDARRLGSFALMAFTSTLCVPFTQALVRNHLATTFGWEATGAWQGVWKISEMYLMLITSTLSVYYLPRLSEIRLKAELRREIYGVYRIVLPFTIAAALACYLLRDILITGLFTTQFSSMRDLFAWQLVGDVMRIGCWLVGFVFQARALTRLFVVSELLYAATFYGLVCLLTAHMGLVGATVAYALSYALYWLWVVIVLREFLFDNGKPSHV